MEFDYRVAVAKAAKADLMEIDNYIAIELNSPMAAANFADAVEKNLGSLSFSPHGHPKVRDDRLAAKGYRWIGIKNYTAFFTIDEQSKTVNVERILYGRRDWQRIL